ncbi:hypothetical protein [Ligilactobacillus sp. Marseille-Q7487]|jgi:hypothetical protein|uniref:hypothetical protein n=1 Tax=Ligilactobacillus sp. Marseille-Q7487 TaxID=3022128 RepID=UPI0015B62864|nr:hypothetical protein [Ligilactobacillus sp. Marseille-Q7487]
MKKTFLLGLGAASAVAFIASMKLTEEQKDKIAMKVDEMLLDGRDTILKYDRYARNFFNEMTAGVDVEEEMGNLKTKLSDKADELREGQVVSEALTSLKKATADLKDYITQTKEDIDAVKDSAEIAQMQDDIVIDGRSAFGEAKATAEFESDHPTETFYPKN